MQKLNADYLVIGSGAMGMAFVDSMVSETDASFVMVDRHHQPGGHWNNAYPFVRLHQPSSFYGVNSKPLGTNAIDTTGWNTGLFELATNSEVVAYFDQVMQQTFLASGRVQYFPMCEYNGDQQFTSSVAGTRYQVDASKIVDATYMNVTVPSMRAPSYEVAEGVDCHPPNYLARNTKRYRRYVVIGAGKTGMDACLFLLKNGVDPSAISWIMPRDSWLLDRANIQPMESTRASLEAQVDAIANAASIEDLFARLVECGALLRLDEHVSPTMYRCATVTRDELDQLRRIPTVVRLGHVQRIETNRIELVEGSIDTNTDTLHIDCTADGLQQRPATPIFDDTNITLQTVRTCQQVFSAAFIGHVEAAYTDQSTKNELCAVIPHPDTDVDFIRNTLADRLSAGRWARDPDLTHWLQNARLDGFSQPPDGNQSFDESLDHLIDGPTEKKQQERGMELYQQSIATLQRLLA